MSEIAPGTSFGPYEILSHLKSGGMGEVYRARDNRLGREVAVKVLPSWLSQDPQRLVRFEQEARATSSLNHPGLVTVHDFGTHEGHIYIVMELLDGETLRDLIHRGPLSPRKALDITHQIVEALAVAHEKGIVHRDLKPENIFVAKKGLVKVLDFGIAKLMGDLPDSDPKSATLTSPTIPGMIVGSFGYMAPEQVQARRVDHRTDIFAVGLLLYEMLTGHGAFEGVIDLSSLGIILTEEPPGLDELSPVAGTIIRQCIEKEPERRFQSAHDLAVAVDAVRGTVTMETPFAFALALKAFRGGGLPSWTLALAAVIGAIVAALAVWNWRGPERLEPPTFARVTFRQGDIISARFGPDGGTVFYVAAWENGKYGLWSAVPGEPDSRALGIDCASLLAVSPRGELALIRGRVIPVLGRAEGTLVMASISGAAPRDVAENVSAASFSPDGGMLAIVREHDGIRSVEYPIGTVVYQAPNPIREIRVSPDGRSIALRIRAMRFAREHEVVVIDVATRVAKNIASTGHALGLAWRDERIVEMERDAGGGSVLRELSLTGDARTLARFDGLVRLMDISSKGSALMTRDEYRSRVFVGKFDAVERVDLSWFDSTNNGDLSADGTSVLLTELGDGGGARYSTFLRRTDGSPAVRLGDGLGVSIAPDGKSVLSIVPGTPPTLMLLPAGAGQPRALERGPIEDYLYASFMLDGTSVAVSGRTKSKSQIYIQSLAASPKPVGPAGLRFAICSRPASPDGKTLAVVDGDGFLALLDVASGTLKRIRGLQALEAPLRWSADGKSLFVIRNDGAVSYVRAVDPLTGVAVELGTVVPPEGTGVLGIGDVMLTPDGKSYSASYVRNLSTLELSHDLF